MKFLFKAKDGGPESKVTGYWLFESKALFSIALLRFDEGSREAFHTHAFHAVSWVLKGRLHEQLHSTAECFAYTPSFKPIYTGRKRYHRVWGRAKETWVLSFRGPWDRTWKEYLPAEDKEITLTNGRKVVEQ